LREAEVGMAEGSEGGTAEGLPPAPKQPPKRLSAHDCGVWGSSPKGAKGELLRGFPQPRSSPPSDILHTIAGFGAEAPRAKGL